MKQIGWYWNKASLVNAMREVGVDKVVAIPMMSVGVWGWGLFQK